MAERKALSKKIRFEVFKRDMFTCQYCGRKAPDVVLEVDHIKPVSKGGSNQLFNLVTSCSACNRGKGARELSDNSAVQVQRRQLEELAQRKEQMEMLMDWKHELLSVKELEVDTICKYFQELAKSYRVTKEDRQLIEGLLHRFTFEEVIEAAEIAIDHYYNCPNAEYAKIAITKIGGICRNQKMQKNDPQLYYFNYIKKCVKSEYSYSNISYVKNFVYDYIHTDEDFKKIKRIFWNSRCWSEFKSKLENAFDSEGYE